MTFRKRLLRKSAVEVDSDDGRTPHLLLLVPGMSTLPLVCGGESLKFDVQRVIAAGYAGRNTTEVRKHIEELKRHGVPAPESFPLFYTIAPGFITTETDVGVVPSSASGEAEAVLLFTSEKLEDALVAVGSDLTDRNVEKDSVEGSKQLAKPISREVWRYTDVAKTWDSIHLRSWTEAPARPYQAGTLANLREPQDLIERLRNNRPQNLTGTVLFMGTIPLLSGGFQFAPFFGCELIRVGGERLHLEYRVTFGAPSPSVHR
jgi:hypothetical protein